MRRFLSSAVLYRPIAVQFSTKLRSPCFDRQVNAERDELFAADGEKGRGNDGAPDQRRCLGVLGVGTAENPRLPASHPATDMTERQGCIHSAARPAWLWPCRMIDDDDWERLLVAIELGEPARLRLRAECLLKMGDRGEVPLTHAVRERLHRIAVAPAEDDRIFLDGFNRFLGG